MTGHPNKESVASCERGAILLMGLFMSVLLVSCLYYLIGIGDTLLFREKMQDAADAGVYSAAIIHARGMNIIVMINIMMAAILAILVVLKLMSTLCLIAIAILGGLAFFTFGATIPFIAPIESAKVGIDEVYDTVKPTVMNLLSAGNKAATLVSKVTPVAAFVEVEHMAVNTYSPPAELAVMFPQFRSLPVEDDSFDVLCGKAGEFAGQLIALPATKILHAKWLGGLLSSAMGGMAKTFSSYFCGSGGSGAKPPELSYEERTDFPTADSPEGRACEAERKKPADQQNAKVMSDQCTRSTQQLEPITKSVDKQTAHCGSPDKDGCEKHKDRARSVCRPGATPDIEKWWWQERRMRRHYRLVETPGQPPRVEVVSDTELSSHNVGGEEKGSSTPPCVFPAGAWSQWNLDVQKPVCTTGPKEPHPIFDLKDRGLTEITIDYSEVTDIIFCQAITEKTVPITDTLEGDREGREPKKVKDCANLGEPTFQLKVAIKGDRGRVKRYEPGVRLAAWGKQPNEEGVFHDFADLMGAFAFAQAEYYWAGGGAPSKQSEYAEWKAQWMWSMAWQARMRRVQLDEDASQCSENEINIKLPLPQGVQKQLNKLLLH